MHSADTRATSRAQLAFFGAAATLLCAQIVAILWLNQGQFSYTLDDPYIHLALANRIHQGHFGINFGEYSSPSSSVLWPLLFALPPASMPGWLLLPLLLNSLCLAGSLTLFWRTLQLPRDASPWGALCLGASLVMALNLTGLVLTGMEHSLQVLMVLLAVHGMLTLEKSSGFPWIAVLALVVGPLLRYENLAITMPACAWLVLVGRWRIAVLVTLLVAAALGAYSAWLLSLGLSAIPTSVLAKSESVGTGMAAALFANLLRNAGTWQAWVMLLFAVLVALRLRVARDAATRRIVAFTLAAVALHLVAGRFGFLSRYEIYLLAAVLLVFVSQYREVLYRLYFPPTTALRALALPALLVVAVGLLNPRYTYSLLFSPRGAHTIYLQQHQMARFAQSYWQHNVAVNDLGAVAFRNPWYVLDFGGLASEEVLKARAGREPQAQWMRRLAQQHHVGLAMIYPDWYPERPQEWKEIAQLRLQGMKVSAAGSSVSFYCTDPAMEAELRAKLLRFAPSVPAGASLVMLGR